MTRVTTDVDALNELFTSGVVSVFGDVFTLVAIMAAMLLLDWRLALVAFAVMPLIALVTQWFRVNVRETYRDVRVLDRPHQRVSAGAHHRHVDRAAVPPRARARFDEFDAGQRAHREANIRSIFYYAVFYPAIEIVGALATALLLWFGGGRVVQDTLTLGTLVAFIQYCAALLPADSGLVREVQHPAGRDGLVGAHLQLLDTPVAISRAGPSADQRDAARTR